MLARIHYRTLIVAYVLKFFQIWVNYLRPLVLQSLLEFITTRQLPGWLVVVLPHHWSRALAPVGGYLLAIIMALLTVLQSVLQQHFLYQSQQAAVRTATSIMSAVFSKSLRLSAEARANFESGEIINMIGGSERKREREKEREREREREVTAAVL